MKKEVLEFLQQSNFIEGVYDNESLEQAIFAWDYLISEDKLSPGVVLKTHKILMLKSHLQPDEKGYFRKHEVQIGWRFGLNWTLVPKAMDRWCEGAMLSLELDISIFGSLDEVEDAIKKDHIGFEKVHPFADGNGRVGRMLMNWQRLKAGLPILIIKEEERQTYYKWFD